MQVCEEKEKLSSFHTFQFFTGLPNPKFKNQ